MKALIAQVQSWFERFLQPSRLKRLFFFLFADTTIIVSSLYAAFLLRFEFVFPAEYAAPFWAWLAALAGLKIFVLLLCGLYNINWRFVGITELKNILKCLFSVTALMAVGNALVRKHLPQWDIPYSIVLIDSVLSFGMMAVLRISKRLYFEFLAPNRRK
ncbi:MAG TPA: hypothetical protein ENN40_05850, partial [Candidatus Aminicenantes bacterium]|nr:hypothetical protein [Candidatus Aminicenantes bacterium]